MTKKKAPKAVTEPDEEGQTCLDQAEDVYGKLIHALHAQIDEGDVNTTLLRDAAGVIRAGATLDAEKRKAAKEARQQYDAFNHAAIVSWARAELTQAERRQLATAITDIDSKGGLLG